MVYRKVGNGPAPVGAHHSARIQNAAYGKGMALGLQGGYSLDGLSGWCAMPGVDSAKKKRRGVPAVLDIAAMEGSGSGSALDLGHPREVITDVA
jgi:hypothetical protein